MLRKDEVSNILDEIKKIFPDAKCELNYQNLYELTIAVVLSAQTTDKGVNRVTPILFEHYPDFESLSKANLVDVQNDIKTIGLSFSKAKNIIALSKMMVDEYHSVVPKTIEELIKLPGVGRKCANVILVEGYHIPAFPVDTHIDRISKRMGMVDDNLSVYEVEMALRNLIDEQRYHEAHHLFIHFGRYFCKVKNPNCEECFYKNKCPYYQKQNSRE